MEEIKKIKVLIKEPDKEPYVKEIEDTLEAKQEIVGGLIELVRIPCLKNVDLYVNEEFLIEQLPGNFWVGEYENCMCGNCLFIGYDDKEDEYVDLTDKQINKIKKYVDTYKIPKGLDLYKDFTIVRAIMTKRYQAEKKKNAEM